MSGFAAWWWNCGCQQIYVGGSERGIVDFGVNVLMAVLLAVVPCGGSRV